MGLQLVALAKLNALFTSHNLTHLLAGLIWPFLIKLSLGTRLVRETYLDLVGSSNLLFFQLRQTAIQAEHIQPSGSDGATSSTNAAAVGSNFTAAGGTTVRWERALRLVYRSMTRARRLMPTPVGDEDSLYALSMIAL
ncbi:hypothetical protein SAY86_020722 [Trapa natans]|uniref:Uncharacterized protein n=1 Tax=Trapa natans TaxID=22666 RepID=A0AAN7LJG3_TRANT|nr:hypothetical protein SAY86_020722 [Trapa natans]